ELAGAGGQVEDPGARSDADLVAQDGERLVRVPRASGLVGGGRRLEAAGGYVIDGQRCLPGSPVAPPRARSGLVEDAVVVGEAPLRGVVSPPHPQLALEVADLFAPLVDALGLDGDDA